LYLDAFFANLNMVVRIGGYLNCKERGVWASERAEFEQNKFYYITKGSCVITIEGKEYRGKPGDCFFIPANTKHSYYNVQGAPFEKYWFHFDLYPNSSLFDVLGLDYCLHNTDETIVALFEELCAKFESEKLTDKLDVKSLMFKILSAFIAASQNEANVSLPESEETITALLSYIRQHLGEPLSNAQLSKLCYLHPNHFVRFFKAKTGTSPQKYIMEQRVQMAKRLIEQTDMKLTDIAVQAGFWDAPHLTKVFKKWYSLTPKECRKGRNRS
jgi:AraC-like DNA-binding protein